MKTNRAPITTAMFLLGLGIIAAPAHAAPFGIGIEPIIGYERVQKLRPTQHTVDRLIYGARLTLGIPLLAAEGQLTRGTDTESFPNGLSVKDTDDKLKLGLRSTFRLGPIFALIGRAGGQARRNTREETLNGVTTKEIGAIQYKPYLGMGLSSRVGRQFDLSGGITAVFNEFPDMSKNEYETTLGFSVRLP